MAHSGGLLTLASTLAVGGGERVLETLLTGLANRGFKQRILFLKEPGPIGEALVDGGIPATTLGLKDTRHPRVLLALLRELKRDTPDLLYLQDHHDCLFWGRIASALAGFLPAVSPVHSSAQGRLRAFRGYNRLVLGLSPFLATLGPWQEAALQRREGVPRGCWVTVPNPVAAPAAAVAASELEKRSGPVRLVTVAALRPEKRLDRMLRLAAALAERRRFTLTLIGDGPERGRLESLRTELGIDENVEFMGRREDVPALLPDYDLFLLTSGEEALPVSVLEALTACLPVAAPPHGAIPSLLGQGKHGLLFAGDDHEAWATQLHGYLDALPDSEALRSRSRELLVQHSPEAFLDRYQRYFLNLGMAS